MMTTSADKVGTSIHTALTVTDKKNLGHNPESMLPYSFSAVYATGRARLCSVAS